MKRFEQIDFLRGLFLIIMTIDHFESPLRRLTYQTFGYVSAAEGFIFVSGLVAGLVYGRRIDKFGFKAVRIKIFSRVLEIYLYHIIILMVLTILLHNFDLIRDYWKDDRLLYDKPVLGFILGAVFLYQPDHLNILPIYCIFLLFAPFVFKALMRGKLVPLLCISFGLWIAGVAGLRDVFGQELARFLPVNLGYFNVLSWQFLFFTGLIFGYYKKDSDLNSLMQNKKLFAFCLVIGFLLFLTKFSRLYLGVFPPLNPLVDKSDLAPLRLLNFFVIAYIISYLLYKFKNFGKFQPIVFLGQHSLQVFAFHVLVTIVVVPWAETMDFQIFEDDFINNKFLRLFKIAMILMIVLSLYIPAYLHKKTLKKKQIKVL